MCVGCVLVLCCSAALKQMSVHLAFPGLSTSVEQQSDKYGSYSDVSTNVKGHMKTAESSKMMMLVCK